MSNISKRRKDGSRAKMKTMGDHKEFLKRITKTLYYGKLPSMPCLSLPVTEISCEVWSEWQRGRSVRRLHTDAAAKVAHQACVSPAALVLALLYMERLRSSRPDYLAQTAPVDLFLVTLMVGNKFLQDDGEDEEVFCSEWAASGGMDLNQLKKLELEFLNAINWNVFVNEKSFECGLQWLEARVALKQAQTRGFFTYTDLLAGCGGRGAAAVRALCVSAAATALCGAALLALCAAVAAAAGALLPSAPRAPAPAPAPATLQPTADHPVDTLTHSFIPPLSLTEYVPNSTLMPTVSSGGLADDDDEPRVRRAGCCASWLRYRAVEAAAARKSWSEDALMPDWLTFEPWWSRTSVLNWLYQTSMIGPLQKWLDKTKEYIDFVKQETELSLEPREKCGRFERHKLHVNQKCGRQWLHLNKFNPMVVSMSDR